MTTIKKEEEWRQIEGTDYYVSSHGRVYSTKSESFLKTKEINGSLYTSAKIGKRQKYISIARLVMLAFRGQAATSLERVDHKDGNKRNFDPDNLVIVPRYTRKLTREDINYIRSTKDHWGHGAKMARKFGVSRQMISLIKQGKAWSDERKWGE